MLGLLIKDNVRWQDRWSVEFGKRFKIHDSSDNLFIFSDECTKEEIISVLGSAPESIYEIFEVETVPKEQCDYWVDSGQCYARKKS